MTEAAFFDLDRTMLPGSSLYPLAWALFRGGDVRPRDILEVSMDQIRFRASGSESRWSMDRARTLALRTIAGRPRDWLLEVGRSVVRTAIRPRLYQPALALAAAHQRAGRLAYLATSSPEDYALLIAEAVGLDGALGTRAEVAGGAYTGRLIGPINHGPMKAARVRAFAERRGIDLSSSFAYSDSISDLPLLDLVGTAVAVNPDRALRAVARRRGWDVLDFRQRRAASEADAAGMHERRVVRAR